VFANSFLYQRYIKYMEGDRMKIEIDREEDGRWIAEIPDLPGVMVYGASRNEAISKAEALALGSAPQ